MCNTTTIRCAHHAGQAGTLNFFVYIDGITGSGWHHLTTAQIEAAIAALTDSLDTPTKAEVTPEVAKVTLTAKGSDTYDLPTLPNGKTIYFHGDPTTIIPGVGYPPHEVTYGNGPRLAAAYQRVVALLGTPDEHASDAAA